MSEYQEYKCIHCKGRGRVLVENTEYTEIEVDCIDCKGAGICLIKSNYNPEPKTLTKEQIVERIELANLKCCNFQYETKEILYQLIKDIKG